MTLRCHPPMLAAPSRRIAPVAERAFASYYQTAEHREWSQKVRVRAGFRCEACGIRPDRLFADHIIELTDGGSRTDLANGQALCPSCHATKTSRTLKARLDRRGPSLSAAPTNQTRPADRAKG